MERTATARRKLVAKPTRLPAGVDLARLEEEGAVRALRVLVVAVERAVARKDLVGQGGARGRWRAGAVRNLMRIRARTGYAASEGQYGRTKGLPGELWRGARLRTILEQWCAASARN
jgi:hypothetical protein